MYLEFFCIMPLYFLHNPDTDIVGFMKDYRRLCPDASVFPKLHYLEDHVVQFIRRWKSALEPWVNMVVKVFTTSLISSHSDSAASLIQQHAATTL